MVFFGAFLLQNKLGRLTGADGGYIIAGERYIPDVAYILYARQPKPSREAYNPNPPDLVVEVLSPSNDDDKMRVKITNYLLVGVMVWVINPETREVEIYKPGHKVKILTENDVLDGDDVLPGFTLAVKDVFPKEDETAE
jgi:Uma2 family endonuclease